MLVKFSGIGIKAISTTVPGNRVKTIEQTKYFSEKRLKDFMDTTGVDERRVAHSGMCSSDLCYEAAVNLLKETPTDISVLIFLSQTPDYRVPGTSIILQDRLGLSTGTIAFDVNMTCSGYIYGLFLAYSLASVGNVLLLVGETMTKITSPNDNATGLLLGDGGSATLISKDDKYGDSFFSLNTDGSYYDSVIIPGGGFRNMGSSDEYIHMDGADVFSFAISRIPGDVKTIMDFANTDIDKIIFHQSNKYMMEVIARKANVDASKMLYSIHKYGNTSGVSIPLTIADHRIGDGTLLLNAIGAGFSWGSAIIKLVDCKTLDIGEL